MATITLEPDINLIEMFTDAVFRHASDGFISLRAFYEDVDKPYKISPVMLSGDNFELLNKRAYETAREAANHTTGVVFCPPIAIFKDRDSAKERNVSEGLTLSVECDQHPQEARAKLEKILGPATAIVRSGGTWTHPQTGEIQNKLHLHWRLTAPARDEWLKTLKLARDIATRIVGGDPSNKPVCHPIRWPGSWHRKREPILCEFEALNPDAEINLAEALDALKTAAPLNEQARPNGKTAGNGFDFNTTGVDWSIAVQGVLSGENYHEALVRLAAKTIASGMSGGAAVNMLRGLMEASAGPRDTRWQSRYDDIPRAVATGEEKFRKGETSERSEGISQGAEGIRENPEPTAIVLPFINFSNWDNEPVPDYEWAVHNRYPLRQTFLFSGEGAAGKSITSLYLCAAHALGKDWLGSLPEPGPAIFIDAEDDEKALHIRLTAILNHCGATFSDAIKGGLHLMSLVGQDAVLGAPTRSGKIEPTNLYKKILEAAGDIKPKMISIASLADVFAGSEIDRSQVKQFISLVTKIAIVANGAVNLIGHPSLTGINSGTGLSGSTQWHNGVRARGYMSSVAPKDGEQPDTNLRQIEFKKNQYGPVSDTVVLQWKDGLFLPVPGVASLNRAAAEMKADDIFLKLLRRFNDQGQDVGAISGTNFAPHVFAKHPDATGLTSKTLREAMQRLLDNKTIKNEPFGPASKNRKRLVIA